MLMMMANKKLYKKGFEDVGIFSCIVEPPKLTRTSHRLAKTFKSPISSFSCLQSIYLTKLGKTKSGLSETKIGPEDYSAIVQILDKFSFNKCSDDTQLQRIF